MLNCKNKSKRGGNDIKALSSQYSLCLGWTSTNIFALLQMGDEGNNSISKLVGSLIFKIRHRID